ncbi:integrin alpha-7 isoform X1 [Xyrauchen texanus]|uniref:integrin alpha-7 isoform X1 n=1 Tax=Xyrauchen texanus TaxID=154827 RepID=UPI0022423DBB|nr:integrin alpha-7 isoform X1 [Xyrauchen texanus]
MKRASSRTLFAMSFWYTDQTRGYGLCWILLCLFCQISAFNLDTTTLLIKEGEQGSFFGFSLALHQQLTPEPHNWILVGAPQARGVGSLRSSRPGALYRCPVTTEKCERVDIDGNVSVERESKHNQWLGVTVKSQGIGGKVVTCAHLYELRQHVNQSYETRDPIGRCYVLSEDLKERDDFDGGEWKFCEGRRQGHEHFGFCQQGMSASFTPDNNYILFGAPGTYNWKGLLFMASPVEDALVYKTLEPSKSSFEDVTQNSYLGFSVDSAKGLMSKSELTFVAGAPRANHTGAVVLLRKDNVYRLMPDFILWGEELASSFGYSVAIADLNSDGWTDLLVGAPNFFDRKAEIGGAVYVFLNPASHWEKARPIRLNGTYDSMFGITVSSIGDLDRDGYDDICVGAPFDGDGKVFIYRGSPSGIDTKPSQVLDGLNAGVKRLGYSISGGLDVDGNFYPDLAVGSLSDQVVLYRSCPVVHVIRDISIEPQYIDITQHNCQGQDGVCVDVKACYTYTAYPDSYSPHITLGVHFQADEERRKLGLPHRVHFLDRSLSEAEYVHSVEVELHGQKHHDCQTVTFVVQENIRDKLRPVSLAITHTIRRTRHHQYTEHLNPLAPVLSPSPSNTLYSEVNFVREGCGEDKICQSNLQLTYQFGTKAAITNTFTPLLRDESDVAIFSLSDQRSVMLEVTVTNSPSDPEHPQEDGDDAHAAQLQVSLPNTLSYSGHMGQQVLCEANQNGSQALCELGNPLKRDATVKFYLILSMSAITIETTSLSVQLMMSTISEQPGLVPIIAYARVVIELPLVLSGLARPHQLFFSGVVKGESVMTSLQDLGSAVDYEFIVSNTGQSLQTFGSASLNILWPYELINGKWLLYASVLNMEGQTHTQCEPQSALNSLGLNLNEPPQTAQLKSSRKVRSHVETERNFAHKNPESKITPAVSASERRRSVTLDCLLGSSRCLVFQCPLHAFSGLIHVRIQAHLWNSTFIEEFSSVSAVELVVRANITIKSTIKHLVLKNAATQVSVMIYPELGLSDQHSIPWWIILIAVLAGIIVLALLVCLLWKCGFFQRVQYTHKVPQYHAVKILRHETQFMDKTLILHKKQWMTHWSDGTI